jgi:hypothetical protein
MKASATTAAVPDPTPALFLLTAGAALAWGYMEMGWLSWTILALSLLPGLLYFLCRDLKIALLVLIGSTVLPHYYVEISGTRARPEHIAIALVSIVAPFWWRAAKSVSLWVRADYLLLSYVAANFLSSALLSLDAMQTLKWAAQQAMVILPYFLLRILVTDVSRFRKAVNLMLLVGVAEALYGVLCFYSHQLWGTSFGMAVDQYETIPGTYGTHLEANLLGSTSAACMIVLLTLYFKAPRPKLLAGIAIAYAGMAVSLSRAAVLAAGFVSAAMFFFLWRKKIITARLLMKVAATVVLTTLVLAPALVSLYNERFSTLDLSDASADGNTTTRVITAAVAYDHIIDHPWLGNGTASFQLLTSYEEMGWGDLDQGAWIGNTEIRILHDTGVVGLLIFALFLWYLFARATALMDGVPCPELTGLVFASLLYLISFQATEGTLMAFSWVHLGLIGCAVSLFSRDPECIGSSPPDVT